MQTSGEWQYFCPSLYFSPQARPVNKEELFNLWHACLCMQCHWTYIWNSQTTFAILMHPQSTLCTSKYASLCKGTSVHFCLLPSSLLLSLVHMYFPHTSVPSPGTKLKVQRLSYSKSDDCHIQSLMTFIFKVWWLSYSKSDDFHIQSLMTFIFKVWWLSYPKSDIFPKVDSPKVIDFLLLCLLVPQQHRTGWGCIGTCPRDTMAPSAVMWIATYGRLGTGRLGTVIIKILVLVWPSQGYLEYSI
jgi:hypothetical protein